MGARARWLAVGLVVAAIGCSHDNRTVLLVYSPHGKELLQAARARE
jgi:hypothetical protein